MTTAKLTTQSETELRMQLMQDTIAEYVLSAEEKAQLESFIQWIIQRNKTA